jgi:hypothetical protein
MCVYVKATFYSPLLALHPRVGIGLLHGFPGGFVIVNSSGVVSLAPRPKGKLFPVRN